MSYSDSMCQHPDGRFGLGRGFVSGWLSSRPRHQGCRSIIGELAMLKILKKSIDSKGDSAKKEDGDIYCILGLDGLGGNGDICMRWRKNQREERPDERGGRKRGGKRNRG